ncbi:MAG: hypothetical protein ACJ8AT_08745 [Hyalangium sp.]|uniref:hypothetical protein n=1 Tax=Hyalangium sp. TaxID=2028555 RepID=UPI003899EB80
MATTSSTRPPTQGEVPHAAEGEPASDVPTADVADWEQVLAQQPQAAAPEGAATSSVPPPVQAGPPVAAAKASPGTRSLVDFPALSSVPVLERPAPPAPVEPLPSVEDSSASVIVDPAQLTAHQSSQPLPGVHTPPPGSPLPVLVLVDQAQQASGEERQELSRRINRWLDKMVREGGSRHVADWFHHLIESGRLEGLEDAAGHGCHETAVLGLLAMGFPYALEVRPEDLERVKPRQEQRKFRRRETNLKGTGAGVVLGGMLGEVLLNLLRARHVAGTLTAEVILVALALVSLLFSKPGTALRNVSLAVLLVASLLSFFLGVMGGYAGLVSGLAGLLAVLLFALHRS